MWCVARSGPMVKDSDPARGGYSVSVHELESASGPAWIARR